VTYAGNPVLSVPNGRRLAKALEGLDFMVAIDLYVNETTRHADLILPPAWTLAEDDIDLLFGAVSARNIARWSPPVVARGPDEKHDWEILLGLSERLGGGPTGFRVVDRALRMLKPLGVKWTPTASAGLLLRTGPHGDRFLPWSRGLSLRKLEQAPHGIDLGPLEEGVTRRVLHEDRLVHVDAPPLVAGLDAFAAELPAAAAEADELLLIGRRELRSNNSWMHNVEALVRGRERCSLRVHPADAARAGVRDGTTAILESRVHTGEVQVEVTDELRPGVVSLPHGWGHGASAPWQRVASRRPGVSFNDWSDDAEVESIVGQSILNGVPVRLRAVAAARVA
jgi:anaerobic selenocysteine-containing dehydrogenase